MCPPHLKIMLGESPGHNTEPNIDNLENNKPLSPTSNNGTNLNATRQVLLKKVGKKLRSTTQSSLQRPTHHNQTQPHQKPPRIRMADHNNNKTTSTRPTVQPHTDVSSANIAHNVLTLHLKQGPKKELLKPKSGKFERGLPQEGSLSVHSLHKHDQVGHNQNSRSHRSKHSTAPVIPRFAKRQDNNKQQALPSLFHLHNREENKPFSSADNVKIIHVSLAKDLPDDLKDADKIYAGAKFSEPPSPSVLPKPPSHWVGEDTPQQPNNSREQMTVHLKSLLKVQNKS